MSFWRFLNQWWNVPFLVLLGLVGVFFVLQTLGLAADSGDDVDLDGDGLPDVDADGDGVPDAEAQGDGPGDAGDVGALHGLAAFLGVGRVPFLVVWLTLFLFTGFTGIFLNRVLTVKLGAYQGWWLVPVLAASFAVGLLATRGASRLAGRLVDVGGKGALRKQELEGALGVVASPALDGQHGEIRVRDGRGMEVMVHARTGPGEATLPQGTQVVLVEWDEAAGIFTAAALERHEPARDPARSAQKHG